MKPRVTWLLPVRNGMPYLSQTLASIEAQTYRDHEVLAWDNGSTDGSTLELQCFIPSRLPGRVVSDRPLSLGLCLAAMTEAAETELCARIDADDINLPERLEQQIRFLDENPQIALVGSNTGFIDETGAALPDAYRQLTRDADLRWQLRWSNAFSHPTVLFRREAILGAGNYRDHMPFEDYDLWMRVAARHEVANLAASLVQYRVRAGGVSGTLITDQRAIDAQAAELNADILFPGLRGTEALEIRDRLSPWFRGRRTPGDLRALRDLAVKLAGSMDKPERYFVNTAFYRTQRMALLAGILGIRRRKKR